MSTEPFPLATGIEVTADELRQLHDPQWRQAGRIHDWRNYVPDEVREVWGELGVLARACIFLVAREGAMKEEWEF